MKTLGGWILGVFSLGLVLGGVFGGTSAEDAKAEETSFGLAANLPAVDCGEGREAVLAPAATGADGRTSLSVKCVATEAKTVTVVNRPAAVQAAPVRAVTTVAQAPASNQTTERETRNEGEVESKRDWKDSALVIGGAAGAGAGIGAIAKGGKGAAVGAAVGGVAGTVYELARKK